MEVEAAHNNITKLVFNDLITAPFLLHKSLCELQKPGWAAGQMPKQFVWSKTPADTTGQLPKQDSQISFKLAMLK